MKGNTAYHIDMITHEETDSTRSSVIVGVEMLGDRITHDRSVIVKIIAIEKRNTVPSLDNYLFTDASESDGRIASFIMFQYFKQHVLEDCLDFQQMLHVNLAFPAYTALSINTNIHSFFANIISHKNSTKVRTLCQHTNIELYWALAATTDSNNLTQSLK